MDRVYKQYSVVYYILSKQATTTKEHTMAVEIEIQLAWEVLPALNGKPHLVDGLSGPHSEFEVSLCGTVLKSRGGNMTGMEICNECERLRVEREREFKALP